MKYKAVLYDMDGTILDTLQDLSDATNYVMSEMGYPLITLEQTRQYVGNGARQLIQRALGKEADEKTVDTALAIFRPYYDAHCRVSSKPYDGILDLMAKLKILNVRQAIVSNKPDSAVKELSKDYFSDLVEIAVGEMPGVRIKPCPDIVESAIAQLGINKSDCVYIGDSEVDIATGRNAEMDCISVAWGFRSVDELKAAGAKHIVYSVDELFDYLCS